MAVILFAMVVIAAAALLINHYVFTHKSGPLTVTTVSPLAKQLRACEADGATVATALSAFKAENPGLIPTESDLVSDGLGGPYLQSWPYDPQYYSYSLKNGDLYLHPGTSGFLTMLPSSRIKFIGPRSCQKFGL
jgi:hypothetical protein